MGAAPACADNSYTVPLKLQQPLTLHVDSMPTTLTEPSQLDHYRPETNRWATKVKQEDIRPYRYKDDLTYAGIPLFIAGIIAKGEKASFRQDYNNANSRTRLITNFHNTIDNYTQFAPSVLAAGLNFAGYQGRSDTWRFLACSAMSYAIMAAIVNPIKYTAKEMRPDGSTRNSWPSGHTATAFVSATILHKEYGLTRSPWFSVGGYAVATATGVMRVLNNRHWVSDVLSGAGIGIISTEFAYGLSDLIFKGKHLHRNDLPETANVIENPSFFDLSMGIGLGDKNISFSGYDLGLIDDDLNPHDVNLKFAASTSVGAEGAYFINRYIGFGGRLRVNSTPIKGWEAATSKVRKNVESMLELYSGDADLSEWIADSHDLTIESDHITEFTADVGMYFNLPLSRRVALGSKLLVGRSVIQDLDVTAHFGGKTINQYPDRTAYGQKYDCTWDYLTVSGNNSFKMGTGLSVIYSYKNNFAWKLFLDYDYTRKHYTLAYSPMEFVKQSYFLYDSGGALASDDQQMYSQIASIVMNDPNATITYSSTRKKHMNNFVLGCCFTVSF